MHPFIFSTYTQAHMHPLLLYMLQFLWELLWNAYRYHLVPAYCKKKKILLQSYPLKFDSGFRSLKLIGLIFFSTIFSCTVVRHWHFLGVCCVDSFGTFCTLKRHRTTARASSRGLWCCWQSELKASHIFILCHKTNQLYWGPLCIVTVWRNYETSVRRQSVSQPPSCIKFKQQWET